MDNIQFEITHERLIAIIAKQLDLEPSQIDLRAITAEEHSAVKATIRTDMPTANKIDKKLRRLDGSDTQSDPAATEDK
jgi:hypothetical protein